MSSRRATTEPAPIEFAQVRQAALAALTKGAFTTAGRWRPCVWQGYRDASHIGPYCNTLSHLETLHDLLEHGSWCDQIVIVPWLSDTDEEERLFRFYGLVLITWSELVQDLRLIRGAALTGERKLAKVARVEDLMGYVNHNFKHRGTREGDASFHQRHHHGPYLFADAPGHCAALPSDGRYVALGHHPPVGTPTPLPLVIPSLVHAMHRTSEALRQISSILRHAPARNRVISAYGVHQW